MPLADVVGTAGVQLASAAGSTDPVGIVAWTAIGAALFGGLPAYMSSFDPAQGTPCAAVGPVVSSGGRFVTIPGAPLGVLLAAAAGSVDPTGVAKWTAVGAAIVSWIATHAKHNVGLVAYTGPAPPPSGPVTGTGTVSFDDMNIGPSLADAAGITPDDAVGQATWAAIGAVILSNIMSAGEIAPGTMQNAIGGPLTGLGTFS